MRAPTGLKEARYNMKSLLGSYACADRFKGGTVYMKSLLGSCACADRFKGGTVYMKSLLGSRERNKELNFE